MPKLISNLNSPKNKFVISTDSFSPYKSLLLINTGFSCGIGTQTILILGMNTCVEGSKRQLPPWMIKKASAGSVSNSESVIEANCSAEKRDNITSNATKKEHKRETSRRRSNLIAKSEVNRKGNIYPQDGKTENITQTKKKKDVRSRNGVQRSSKKERRILQDLSHGSNDVNSVQASDDGVELTVEDLMAIAEQYVKEHENKEQQKNSVRQCESKWQFPVKTEAGTTLDSPSENKKSSSPGSEVLYDPTPTDELIATSTSQTGDPAQDMLDLLLGPLLRKTLEKEEKSKSTAENVEVSSLGKVKM